MPAEKNYLLMANSLSFQSHGPRHVMISAEQSETNLALASTVHVDAPRAGNAGGRREPPSCHCEAQGRHAEI